VPAAAACSWVVDIAAAWAAPVALVGQVQAVVDIVAAVRAAVVSAVPVAQVQAAVRVESVRVVAQAQAQARARAPAAPLEQVVLPVPVVEGALRFARRRIRRILRFLSVWRRSLNKMPLRFTPFEITYINLFPQPPQNFVPGSLSIPQAVHFPPGTAVAWRLLPQLLQKRTEGAFFAPHLAHSFCSMLAPQLLQNLPVPAGLPQAEQMVVFCSIFPCHTVAFSPASSILRFIAAA